MVLRAGNVITSEQPGLALRGLHLSSAASDAADEILHLNAPVLPGFHLLLLGFRNNYLHFYVSVLTGWCNCYTFLYKLLKFLCLFGGGQFHKEEGYLIVFLSPRKLPHCAHSAES